MKSLEAVEGLGSSGSGEKKKAFGAQDLQKAIETAKSRLRTEKVAKKPKKYDPTKARLLGMAYVAAIISVTCKAGRIVYAPLCLALLSPLIYLQCGFFGKGIQDMSVWERIWWEVDQYKKRKQRSILRSKELQWKNSNEKHIFDSRPCPRFDANDPKLLSFLKEEGFVVVKSVASASECQHAKDLLWKFLETNTDMVRKNADSWTNTEMQKVGDNTTGILVNAGFGQSEFCWFSRLLPSVKKAFANVWEDDKLIVSFDGGNLFRPFHRNRQTINWKTSGNWFHVDQGRKNPGFCCVQGMVSYCDANEETGGLCVLPKSHLKHTELMKYAACNDNDLVPVPIYDEILSHKKLVTCKAGDLILWDSRTCHCNTPAIKPPKTPTTEPIRVVSYVCMTPKSFASTQVLNNRKRAFLAGLGTTHWPHIFKAVSKPSWDTELSLSTAEVLDLDRDIKAASVSQEQQELIGI